MTTRRHSSLARRNEVNEVYCILYLVAAQSLPGQRRICVDRTFHAVVQLRCWLVPTYFMGSMCPTGLQLRVEKSQATWVKAVGQWIKSPFPKSQSEPALTSSWHPLLWNWHRQMQESILTQLNPWPQVELSTHVEAVEILGWILVLAEENTQKFCNGPFMPAV